MTAVDRLLAGLLMASILGVGAGIWLTPDRQPLVAPAAEAASGAAATTVGEEGIEDKRPVLDTLLARPVFHPERRAELMVLDDAPGPAGRPDLQGLFTTEVGRARAVLVLPDGTVRSGEPGERVGGWLIEAIDLDARRVRLVRGEETVDLMLRPTSQ